MKKITIKTFIILLAFIITNCNKVDNEKLNYHTILLSTNYFEKTDNDTIIIELTNNSKQLIRKRFAEQNNRKDSFGNFFVPIQMEEISNNPIYIFSAYYEYCKDDCEGTRCFVTYPELRIELDTNESYFINKRRKNEIGKLANETSLLNEINKHYLNFGKEFRYSESPDKAYICIYMKHDSYNTEHITKLYKLIIIGYLYSAESFSQTTFNKEINDLDSIQFAKLRTFFAGLYVEFEFHSDYYGKEWDSSFFIPPKPKPKLYK